MSFLLALQMIWWPPWSFLFSLLASPKWAPAFGFLLIALELTPWTPVSLVFHFALKPIRMAYKFGLFFLFYLFDSGCT